MAAEALGLLECPQLALMIETCQRQYGKKVLLSIGGATSQISFKDEGEANDFADKLWQVFGPPGGIDGALRPFGSVEVDGFDVGMLLVSRSSSSCRSCASGHSVGKKILMKYRQ